ncbi:hypothetical protein TruAng_008222 [Truncatella angustata]|nr:hypothetical protein TruAng_008222 [Truncatella angustata]
MLRTTSLAAIAFLATTGSCTPHIWARDTTTTSLTQWVSVDDNGTAHTVTPYVTTISGAATTVSAAPYDITGTVFTQTNYGKVTTSTGTTPNAATATATSGAGSFKKCNNKDGANAPFCWPKGGSTLNPGLTYYFTWDSSYFAANSTILITGDYLNSTTGEISSQAFQSDKMVASWGFWAMNVQSSLVSPKNISVSINAVNVTTGTNSTVVTGPTIAITNPPVYHQPAAKLPSGAALYIALPTVFGFIIVCLVGGCIWNRKHRRIELGNVMSRTRHGGGLGKLPGRGGKRRKEQKAAERVQLLERDIIAEGGQLYRDEPQPEPQYREPQHREPERREPEPEPLHREVELPRPRRDSDALGSLAGTPTEDRRMEFQRPSAIRDSTGSSRPGTSEGMRKEDKPVREVKGSKDRFRDSYWEASFEGRLQKPAK